MMMTKSLASSLLGAILVLGSASDSFISVHGSVRHQQEHTSERTNTINVNRSIIYPLESNITHHHEHHYNQERDHLIVEQIESLQHSDHVIQLINPIRPISNHEWVKSYNLRARIDQNVSDNQPQPWTNSKVSQEQEHLEEEEEVIREERTTTTTIIPRASMTTTRPFTELEVDMSETTRTGARHIQEKQVIGVVEEPQSSGKKNKRRETTATNLIKMPATTTTTSTTATTTITTATTEIIQSQGTNQERSQRQMPTGSERVHSKGEQDTNKTPAEVARRPVRSTAPQLQTGGGGGAIPVVQALAGRQLSIPCSNLSTRASSSAGGSARPLPSRAGSNQSRPAESTRKAATGGGGGVALIVWHKDDQLNEPIFVADGRGVAAVREMKQQTLADHLKGRARLEEPETASQAGLPGLFIEEASMQEAGLYTCTVEFLKAPTQTFQVRVHVVDPPKNMLIRDLMNTDELPTEALQAHDEDSRLELSCQVELLGQPPQVGFVSWWQLESVVQLPQVAESSPQQARRPTLVFSGLDRANYITTLSVVSEGQQARGSSSPATSNMLIGVQLSSSSAVGPAEAVGEYSADSSPSPSHSRRLLKQWRKVSQQTSWNANTTGDNRLQVTLEVAQLRRAHLETEFMCLANNNNFSAPLNNSIRLDMNLKPTEVKILNKANLSSFRLDQKTLVECQVFGSKPSALIRWIRAGEELDLQQQQQQTGADQSSFIMPKLSDNQQTLSCLGSNPKMSNAATLSDSITMNVQFAPRLELQFGANIGPDSIRLASDVFMDCNVHSNPPIDDNDLSWLFNGQPLAANVSAGIIMSNRSLALQRIRVESRGSYQCLARNSIGSSSSNKLQLRPRFEPICDEARTRTRYEVALNQATRIECHVLAEPGEDLHFSWRFNQTNQQQHKPEVDHSSIHLGGGHVDDMLRQYETNFTKSSVIFTPTSRRHYGQLLCSATNSMGRQERPCIIQVVPSELPEPVVGCFVDNQTQSSFSVHCQPSSSSSSPSSQLMAGKQLQYLLELSVSSNDSDGIHSPPVGSSSTHLKSRQPSDASNEPDDEDDELEEDPQDQQQSDDNFQRASRQRQQPPTGRIKRRLLSDLPSFNVVDLRPNSTYNIQIYVQNAKGKKSSPFFQQANTRPDIEGLAVGAGATGRVELMGNSRRAPAMAEAGLSNRLMSYLKLDDYFGGGGGGESGLLRTTSSGSQSKQPVVAIALVMLLMAVTLVMVIFFVNRLCRSPMSSSGRPSSASGRKRPPTTAAGTSLSSASSMSVGARLLAGGASGGEHRDDGSSSSRTVTNTSTMATTSNSNNANTATTTTTGDKGSGSDTSRETTNTDSTLVSSPHQLHHGHEPAAKQQRLHQYHQQMAARYGTTSSYCGARRYSQNGHNLEGRNSVSAAASMSIDRRLVSDPSNKRGRFAEEVPVGHHLMADQHSANMSIQSGSDCTSTNDDHQQPVYVINRSAHNNQQQLRFVASPGGFWSSSSPPPTTSNMNGQQQQQQQQHQQLASLSCGTQHSSSLATADSSFETAATAAVAVHQHHPMGHHLPSSNFNRCELVDDNNSVEVSSGREQLLNAAGLAGTSSMTTSMSIPVSLSDRLQVLRACGTPQSLHHDHMEVLPPAAAIQRYSSQDYLQQVHGNDMLNQYSGVGNTGGGSYLTLAPTSSQYHNHHHLPHHCFHQYQHEQQQQQQQQYNHLEGGVDAFHVQPAELLQVAHSPMQSPSTANDFANDYRRFKETFGIMPNPTGGESSSCCSGTPVDLMRAATDDRCSTATTTSSMEHHRRLHQMPSGHHQQQQQQQPHQSQKPHRVKFDTTN